MANKSNNEKLSETFNLNIEGLENSIGKVKENVVELTAYDGKIDAFQISPSKELASVIIEDSNRLFQTDILKLDADILNPSLGLDPLKTDIFDTQSIINVNEGISSLINDSLKLSETVDEIIAVDPSWSKNYDPLKLDITIDETKGSARLPNLDLAVNELASNTLFSESTYLNLEQIGNNIESIFPLSANKVLSDYLDSFSKFASLIALDDKISS